MKSWCFSSLSSLSFFSDWLTWSLISSRVMASCLRLSSCSRRNRSMASSASCSCFLRSRSRMMWALRAAHICRLILGRSISAGIFVL
uniref:Putative secreted protein n=1 Tax=Ixodes ricinus TaxID=34613 RepID=A0A6B0UA65_IXORI